MARFLPDILPADPCAPEHIRHRAAPLRYGPIGRTVLGLSETRLLGRRR